jgi:hypothetical protein
MKNIIIVSLILGTLFGYYAICYFVFFLRSKRIHKIARKNSLIFKQKIHNESGLKRFNSISGIINSIEINFYDEKRRVNLTKEIQDRINEIPNAGEVKKDLYSNIINTYRFPNDLSRAGKTSPERISYLTIGDKTKKIGRRGGTMNIVDKSDLYMSTKLLDTILSEIKESGNSETFNSLTLGNTKKFYMLTMPYVKDVEKQSIQ